MTYRFSFFLSMMDNRIRDLIHNGGMPNVTQAIQIQHFGYKHSDRPELQPYMVELLGIPEQVYAPSPAAFAVARRDGAPLKPHPPLVIPIEIKDEAALAYLGTRSVYYHVGSEVIVYIWLARLKRAVAGDRHTSLALTDRNFKHARFSPVVHERLYYQSGIKEETSGGELLKTDNVDFHTSELMKGYDLFRFATSVTPENGFAIGKPPKYATAAELLTAMNAAWDRLAQALKPGQAIGQPDMARALGYSPRGFTSAMGRLGVNYKTWYKGKK
jgi:hypothetical protein